MPLGIQVRSLSKVYHNPEGRKVVLDRLDLDVARGSLICALGSNGAGKSTLMKCISGLSSIDSGSVRIKLPGGQTYELTAGSGRLPHSVYGRLGVVFQETALWSILTVKENLVHPLMHTKSMTRARAVEKAETWLRRVGVSEHLWDRLPDGVTVGGMPHLSGGERRKVAFARTLCLEPEILILDEVEAHLDPEALERILAIIEDDYIHRPDRTVLMVTHRIDFLTRAAAKVVIIDGGKVAEQRTPQELIESPSARVKSLLASLLDPSRSDAAGAEACLSATTEVSSIAADTSKSAASKYWRTCAAIEALLTRLEPEHRHLVMLVTRDPAAERQLRIAMIAASKGFVFNGEDVEVLDAFATSGHLRRGAVAEDVLRTDYGDAESFPGQVVAKAKTGLITWIFENNSAAARLDNSYQYSPGWPKIRGVVRKGVGGGAEPAWMNDLPYLELSKDTKQVYLFEMLDGDRLVGVLSIDTTADRVWTPSLVRQLKLVANVASFTMR